MYMYIYIYIYIFIVYNIHVIRRAWQKSFGSRERMSLGSGWRCVSRKSTRHITCSRIRYLKD